MNEPSATWLPGKCDVCGTEGPVAVVCSATGPCSYAYCKSCGADQREPYRALVAMAACCGGVSPKYMARWAFDLIKHNLERLDKSWDEFEADLEEVMQEQPPQ